jgi:hypothetical protein
VDKTRGRVTESQEPSMNPHHSTFRALSPADEALELRDIGARDCNPTQDADAFPRDEVDECYVADMQAREAARQAGFVPAMCLGCGVALLVPEHEQCGDVLCSECQRTGEALAADEDDADPKPPTSGALRPEAAEFAASAARFTDDQLITAVYIVDEEPHTLRLDERRREDWLSAMTAEILRRGAE